MALEKAVMDYDCFKKDPTKKLIMINFFVGSNSKLIISYTMIPCDTDRFLPCPERYLTFLQ